MIAPGAISPFNPYIAAVGAAAITDEIYFDSAPAYSDNAVITNRGTNGTNGTAYSSHVVDFDGSTGYVNTGQVSTIERTDAFVVDVWIYPDSLVNGSVISNRTAGSAFQGWDIEFRSDGRLRFVLCNDNATNNKISVTTPGGGIVAGKWIHTVATYDGSSTAAGITISIDDVDQSLTVDTDSLSSTIITAEILSLGYRVGPASNFFSGQISNPQITINGTLTHSWEMMEGKESLTFDSVQGVAGVLTGNAVWVTGLSGLENGETHNGLPQNLTRKWNPYDSSNLTGTTSLSGTALTGSGTSFTTELSVNDIVYYGGDIARVTAIADNTNATVVNINSASWTTQTTVVYAFEGSEVPLPKDANNAGFDIGGNAITPSGDTFRADGLSDIDANVVSTLDYNSVINIVAESVNIYESQAINTVYSNRDNTANQRGILAYLDASDRPVLLLQRDTTTRVQVQSNVAISAGNKVAWKSDGTGDASGVTIEINDAAVATTTLQDQDISGGITSAVNAQWFVDLDGTANKFKGTVTIIKVQ